MKKLFILVLMCIVSLQFTFSQSVLLTPDKMDQRGGSSDNIFLRNANAGSPNFFAVKHNGTFDSPTATASGSRLLGIEGAGFGTSITTSRIGIVFNSDENWTATANGTRMTFTTTTNGTTSNTERMRIDNTGNVGIGTTNPLKRLHVSDGSAGIVSYSSNSSLLVEDNVSNYIQMGSPEASEVGVLFGKPSNSASGGIIYNGSNGINLRTGGNFNRMTISSNGDVGVGTTSPARKFHVTEGTSGVTSSSLAPIFVESNSNTYLQLASPESNFTGVLFGKPSNSFSGAILYDGSSNLFIRTGGNLNRMTITSAGNVGIGTISPTAKLDIEGDIVVKKTTISTAGTQNALNRSGGSSIYFNVSGTVTLNGIAGGADGMILYIFTALSTTLVINNENASAATGNRIATNTGGTITISGRGGATLIYDSNTDLWRVIGLAN